MQRSLEKKKGWRGLGRWLVGGLAGWDEDEASYAEGGADEDALCERRRNKEQVLVRSEYT